MDFKLNDVDFTLEQFEEKFRGKEASKITVFEFFFISISKFLNKRRLEKKKYVSS